jgi:Zn-dependent protease
VSSNNPKTLVTKIKATLQEQKIIWWLIEKQNNPKSQILGVLAFVAIFWIAFQNPWAVVAMLLGMYIHELGHFAMFVYNDIKTVILFLFPLGAVAAPINKDENCKSDLLPLWNIGWILQAGPTMNILQIAFGQILVHTMILPELGRQMIFINGVLAMFNLLPLWNIDGGQLFQIVFSSLKKKSDRLITLGGIYFSTVITTAILIFPIGLGKTAVLNALIQNFGAVIFLLLMAVGIWHKQKKYPPKHWNSTQSMTNWQTFIQIAYYFGLVMATFLLKAL